MAESPTNGCFATIAVTRPDRDMTLYVFQSCEASSQALFREYGYFNLGHVQPTGVFRCVMPRDPLQKWCGSFWPEGFDQRLRVVGVEVIEGNVDTTGLGITIQEIAHEPGEVGLRAMFPRLHESPAPSRFHGHKNTACSATSIFVVLFGDLAGERLVVRDERRRAIDKAVRPCKSPVPPDRAAFRTDPERLPYAREIPRSTSEHTTFFSPRLHIMGLQP